MQSISSTVLAVALTMAPVIANAQPPRPASSPPHAVSPAAPAAMDSSLPDLQTLRGTIDSLDAEQRTGPVYVPAAALQRSPIPEHNAPPNPAVPAISAPAPFGPIGIGANPAPGDDVSQPAISQPAELQPPVGWDARRPAFDERAFRKQQRALEEQQERDDRAHRTKDAGQRANDLINEPEQPPVPLVPGMQDEGRAASDDAVARLGRLIEVQTRAAVSGLPRFVADQLIVALPAAPVGIVQPIVRDLESRHGIRRVAEADMTSIAAHLVLFELGGRHSVAGAAARLAADPRVSFAQPNYLFETAAEHRDALAALQYGPRMLNVLPAHDAVTGRAVGVAIIDTAVDARHPDLASRIALRANFVDADDRPEIHGTAVAGIVAATADNEVGIYGVAPQAAILALRACSQRTPEAAAGVCTSYALGRAIDFAIAEGARVINLSLAGPRDQLLPRVLQSAYDSGIVAVAAVGNFGPKAAPTYPAALPSVIAVTALDARAMPYAVAVQGPFVKLAAPGVDVVTTSPDNGYVTQSGTSMAAAHVSGIVALVLQARPDLSPAAVRTLLESTARSHGLVDACAAVNRAIDVRLGC
jgi:subtilisin family serine protease